MTSRAALILAACWLLVGCKAREEKAPASTPEAELPPEISKNEGQRGDAACASLAKKACECAAAEASNKALASECELAKTRPGALTMAVKIARQNRDSVPKEMWETHNNARKIMKACIEDDLKFQPKEDQGSTKQH